MGVSPMRGSVAWARAPVLPCGAGILPLYVEGETPSKRKNKAKMASRHKGGTPAPHFLQNR